MLPYTIDDEITNPLTCSVEVTVDFGTHKRWLFFATPELLASVGDYVDGTNVRIHLGEPHMIVVSEISREIVDKVLRTLFEQGELERHTIPLA